MQAQGKLPGMEKLTMTIIRTICAGILTLTLSSVATYAQQILNGGFETADGIYTDTANSAVTSTGALDWIQFNNSVRLAATNSSTFGFTGSGNGACSNYPGGISTVHSGNWSLWCFGDATWTGEGAWQIIPGVVTPGQQWVLSAWEMTPCSDPLTNIAGGVNPPGTPFGNLQLQFGKITWPTNPVTHVFNTNFTELTSAPAPNFYGSNGFDVWVFESATGTVPAGATTMAVYAMELGWGAGANGSVLFDDLSLVNLNAPITTNFWQEFIAQGNQVCWVSDTNSTWQPQASVNNSSWYNLGQPLQGDGNTDCVFDTSLSNKYYRVLQLQ